MRIALVVAKFDQGGVETHLLRLGGWLRNRGHQVCVVTTDSAGEWYGLLRRNGLPSQNLDVCISASPVRHARRIAEELTRGRHEIVVLNHARLAQASLARLPEDVVAVPVIHNDVAGFYATGCANPRAWDVVVGVSPGVERGIRRHVTDRPVVRIPYGIELPAPSTSRPPASSRPLRLLFAGRLVHEQKGVLLLPDILAAMRAQGRPCRLVVVGDGPDRGRLEQRLEALGVAADVQFEGFVAPEAMPKHFDSAHVLLLPSFFEGLGIVLLEAMAAGCVPVASRLEGVTDAAVDDPVTGFLSQPGDVDGFVRSLTRLYDDPESLAAMSARCVDVARARFGIDRMGEQYEGLFRRALAGEFPRPVPRASLPAIDPALLTEEDHRRFHLRSRVGYRVRRLLGRIPA